ncbi:MAG: BACON domain-containing protein [Bacteroidetes bacterium]|nr:BACON domain-containing protein [Bacteroidota bacterium]MCL5024973.1 BACON domain-containing protein [Chloroflexota bacterium]
MSLWKHLLRSIRWHHRGHRVAPWWQATAVALLLVATMLASGLLATEAEAMPDLAPVGVTSVGISAVGDSAPGAPPVTVSPGGQFKAWFTFRNETLVPYPVGAGVVIVDTSGTMVNDAMLHILPTCTVPAATIIPIPYSIVPGTITCPTTFTLPSSAVGGSYTVRYSAANFGATPTPFTYSEDKPGWLIVTGPRLCASPTSLDFADTGSSANLSITNCGTAGTTLTWNAASSQPWLNIGLPSGTGNAVVPVTLNRSLLAAGANTANINLTSNGGPQTIAVSATGAAGATATPTTSPTPTTTAVASVTVTPSGTPTDAGGPGQFFSQTNFWVRDNVPIPDGSGRTANFLSEYNRFGGLATLGYPASRPYWKDGFFYQVFQRGILQWRPDYNPPQAVFANTMDWLNDAGKDGFLAARGVPTHFSGDDGAGGDFNRAVQIRFGWMTEPSIRDTYLANPNPALIPDSLWDPVTFYGLPTSQPQRSGPFTVQRFQRYVLQKWEDAVVGMPAPGSVVGVLAGDLAKEAGLVPAAAMQTETP